MPSQQDVPSAADILAAYDAEIAALERSSGDLRSGSGYDIHGGVGAILFHRQSIHDRDRFRSVYFDTAQGDDADTLIRRRYGILAARIPDLPGTGIASLSRTGTSAGTFYEGTRFSVLPNTPGGAPRTFEVSQDTAIGSGALQARVPIRDMLVASSAVVATTSTNVLTIDDPLWDTWSISSVQCGPGTFREDDDTYKARIKATRLAQRKGYADGITNACKSVGASQVAIFPSDWTGIDHGINHLFVADDAFVTTDSLLQACRVVVDSWRVLGADLFVFGMQNTPLSISVTVQVWNIEQTRASQDISDLAVAAVVDFFKSSANQFYWTATAIESAIHRQIRGDAQKVTVTASLPEPTRSTMLDVALLPRYVVDVGDVSVSVIAPS